jgi:hypothetical protein
MKTDFDADMSEPTRVPKDKHLSYNNIQIFRSKHLSHFWKIIPGQDNHQKGAVSPRWDGSGG